MCTMFWNWDTKSIYLEKKKEDNIDIIGKWKAFLSYISVELRYFVL